jgi:hypothetical protein
MQYTARQSSCGFQTAVWGPQYQLPLGADFDIAAGRSGDSVMSLLVHTNVHILSLVVITCRIPTYISLGRATSQIEVRT